MCVAQIILRFKFLLAGAIVVGAGIVIEKGFQKGGDMLREQGLKLESLAIIDSLEGDKITFRD